MALTTTESAYYLSLTELTVLRLVAKGWLHPHTGGRLKFEQADLDALKAKLHATERQPDKSPEIPLTR